MVQHTEIAGELPSGRTIGGLSSGAQLHIVSWLVGESVRRLGYCTIASQNTNPVDLCPFSSLFVMWKPRHYELQRRLRF
jgi:hypothetical protein